jgi:hypothetical protein
MSSYGLLFVGSVVVGQPRNTPPDELMSVFRDDMLHTRLVPGSEYYESENRPSDEHINIVEFRAPGRHIQQRLDLLGVDSKLVLGMLDTKFKVANSEVSEIVNRQINEIIDETKDEQLLQRIESDRALRRSLNGLLWLERLAAAPPNSAVEDIAPGSRSWLMEMLNEWDWPHALRAVLLAFPDEEVVLDVTELAASGWLGDDQTALPSGALNELRDAAAVHAPVIVLTEGVNDAEFLADGVQILYPHLTDLIRFLDYERKPDGGVGALLHMIRSFAAAGVANRIIAVHDNDAAAFDGLRNLNHNELPSRMHVMSYPTLELAKHYPTLGPPTHDSPDVSIGHADLNGSACSIEMYLGQDVLESEAGTLRPVQWTSFISSLGRYQGEITGKKEIHKKFRAKYAMARAEPSLINRQDWSGLKLVIDAILSCLNIES